MSHVNQDVQELFKILLDRLEEAVGAKSKHVLTSTLCGSMTSFVRCAEIGYESFRAENTMDLSLAIKDKATVIEALLVCVYICVCVYTFQ